MFLILDILTLIIYLYAAGAVITVVLIGGLGVLGTVGHGINDLIRRRYGQ